jgi:hypothetical protein
MNRAKEHVIVVLINFKELVEVNKLKREAKNRYENNIIVEVLEVHKNSHR